MWVKLMFDRNYNTCINFCFTLTLQFESIKQIQGWPRGGQVTVEKEGKNNHLALESIFINGEIIWNFALQW